MRTGTCAGAGNAQSAGQQRGVSSGSLHAAHTHVCVQAPWLSPSLACAELLLLLLLSAHRRAPRTAAARLRARCCCLGHERMHARARERRWAVSSGLKCAPPPAGQSVAALSPGPASVWEAPSPLVAQSARCQPLLPLLRSCPGMQRGPPTPLLLGGRWARPAGCCGSAPARAWPGRWGGMQKACRGSACSQPVRVVGERGAEEETG